MNFDGASALGMHVERLENNARRKTKEKEGEKSKDG